MPLEAVTSFQVEMTLEIMKWKISVFKKCVLQYSVESGKILSSTEMPCLKSQNRHELKSLFSVLV